MSRAFIINLMYESSDDSGVLYAARAICAIDCEKMPRDDDCMPEHSAQTVESIYLDHELAELNAMAQGDGVPAIETVSYVLDIDLDYFHSEAAIEPSDPATFYRLVPNAVAVTIATEPDYVKGCRDEGSEITGESLLARMKQHIEAAMA